MLKTMATQLTLIMQAEGSARNIRFLVKFCIALLVLILVYTVLFHLIMLHEEREYSWITGLYWTLTTMSTLGFGDITFTSDMGKIFSVVVLMSGMVLLLIMLPFTFIQFFYAPWLEEQNKGRVQTTVPKGLSDHVVFTHFDNVAVNLIEKLRQYGTEHVIVVPELSRALELHDRGYRVLFGDLDDPDTYHHLRVDHAAMVVVLNEDIVATNIILPSARSLTACSPSPMRI